MVQDTGNTHRWHTLFRKTFQQYWVMKNVMAHAMTLNKEQVENKGQEAQEDNKGKEPYRADLLKEIAEIQIKKYRNNLALGRIEQSLQDMRRSEMSGSSAKAPAPMESSNEE